MKFLSLFFYCFILISCQKTVGDDTDFSYYNLKNTGWKSKNHTVNIDNFSFVATEVPILYYIAESEGEENQEIIEEVYSKLKTQRIIEFVIENKSHKDLFDRTHTNIDYAEAVAYFSSTIQDDFFVLTSENDTISCVGILFERTFKLTPYKKILLYFDPINPDQEIELVYRDHLFNKGEIRYKFNNHLIKL